MKKLIIAAAIAMLATPVMAGDPVEGMWRTHASEETGGHLVLKMAKCGSKMCGTIVAAVSKDGESDPNYAHLGKKFISGMKIAGGGEYTKGKIWNPQEDKTYKSSMTLVGDKLNVDGCVLVFCKHYTWNRMK